MALITSFQSVNEKPWRLSNKHSILEFVHSRFGGNLHGKRVLNCIARLVDAFRNTTIPGTYEIGSEKDPTKSPVEIMSFPQRRLNVWRHLWVPQRRSDRIFRSGLSPPVKVHERPLEVSQVIFGLCHDYEAFGDVRIHLQDFQGVLSRVSKMAQLQVTLASAWNNLRG